MVVVRRAGAWTVGLALVPPTFTGIVVARCASSRASRGSRVHRLGAPRGDSGSRCSLLGRSSAPSASYSSTVIGDHPSAYYRLRETSGAVAVDSSGNGRNATYTGNTTLGVSPGAVIGDTNTAISGTGAGTLAAGSPGVLPIGNAARSIEAWVRTTATGTRGLAGYGATGFNASFSVAIDPTHVQLLVGGDDLSFAIGSGIAINDGAWHQVVASYDGSTATAYLDGVSIGAQTLPAALSTKDTSGLQLGSDFQGGDPLSGALDEVSAYPTALTASQVLNHDLAAGYQSPSPPRSAAAGFGGPNTATISWGAATGRGGPVTGYIITAFSGATGMNAVATDGTQTAVRLSGLAARVAYTFHVIALNQFGDSSADVSNTFTPTGAAVTYASTVIGDHPSAFFRLGERSGAVAADSSGNGRTATYTGTTSLRATGAIVADPDTAVSGGGGVVAVSQPGGLPVGNASRSVEAWVNTTSAGSATLVGYGGGGSDVGLNVAVDAHHILVTTGGDDLTFQLPRAINDGAWHQVVVTYNGSGLTAYLDGQPVTTKSFANPLSTTDTGLQLGGGLTGKLDEVAVYPAALSASQVLAHFRQSGYALPGQPASVSATAGPTNSDRVSVSWSAAAAPASSPVTRYVLTAFRGSSPLNAVATGASTTTATLSGLVGGAAYTFQVYAINAYGNGLTRASNAVTPSGPATTYASTVIGDHPSIYFRLGEQSGSVAADSSGNQHTAVYATPAPALGASGAIIGDTDTAVTATTTNPTIAMLQPDGLPAGNTPRSIEAWVNLPTTTTGQAALPGYGAPGTDNSFNLAVDPHHILLTTGGDDLTFPLPRAINDGTWHQIAATYNGTTLTAYLDGQPVKSGTFANPLATTDTSGLQLGTTPNGQLDDVSLYPTTLTPTQITTHFQQSGHAVPTQPTNITAKLGLNPGQAAISWTASTAPNDAVTGYLVTETQGVLNGMSVETSTPSAVMSGLPGGASYQFSVTAIDAYGASQPGTSNPLSMTGPSPTYASTVLLDHPTVYYRLGEPSNATIAGSRQLGDRAARS